MQDFDTTDGLDVIDNSTAFDAPLYTTRDFGEDIINLGNDLDPNNAVLLYGIVAGVQAMIPLIVTLFLRSDLPTYLSAEFFTYIFQGVWMPTFLSWLAMTWFDNDIVREFFMIAIYVSFTGPFFFYFVGLADLLIKVVELDLVRKWDWWVTMIVGLIVTVGSIFYQIVLVPRIIYWVETTPVKNDTPYEPASNESDLASIDF